VKVWRCVAFLVILGTAQQAAAQEIVIVLRHAERADDSADTLLSAAGEVRAQRLADLLKDVGITRVFTTTRRRTIQTAAPLAAARRLTPAVFEVEDRDGLIAKVRASAPTDRVLIVGHGLTVPGILHALGVTTEIAIGEEYDNLFIVVPQTSASPVLLRLRY
jgi:broad specificity phosphatase PhoE